MLAPLEKLEARKNDIIQIVLTRNCDVFNCSNCTQLLPFRKDAREMSLGCVEEALLSVAGWPGVAAAFGGNPCTHSRFPEVCALWQKHVPDQRRRGLWTNNLLRHGAVARETFHPRGRFNLNAHGNAAAAREMRRWLPGVPVFGESGRNHHAAMLLDYRDYGIAEAEWAVMRERCDINQKWSAGIYQGPDGKPYAYFCEVAGSLDGVRGECNGVPAVPGWWRQPMEHFRRQVGACCDRGCGVPLRGTGHQDADAAYDVSPSWVDLTERRTGRVVVEAHAARPAQVHESTDYIGHRLRKK